MQQIGFAQRGISGWSGGYAIERFGYLIDGSRFGDKIRYLMDNPELARRIILEGNNLKPNCWGTVAYVLGVEDLITKQYVAEGNRLDDFSSAEGDFIFFPENSTPGYVGREPFDSFLNRNESVVEVDGFSPDSIIAFYWENEYGLDFCGFGQRHAGICLGCENGNRIFFHQESEGMDFGIETVGEYEGGKYSKFRETMQERFFRFPVKQ